MDNLTVVIEDMTAKDERWEDETWLAEQAEISAAEHRIEMSLEVA